MKICKEVGIIPSNLPLMPARKVVARELADLFGVLAHPDRIRLIEELREGELDVSTLQQRLELSGPRVSQHLGLLRAYRLVEERREGRHHYYHLVATQLAEWILEGLGFVRQELAANREMKRAMAEAVSKWRRPVRR